MALNSAQEDNLILHDHSDLQFEKLVAPQAAPRKYEIVYENILGFAFYHFCGLYGLYLAFTSAMWQTNLFTFINYFIGAIGITAGVHRLWAHKSYKATKPLQLILMVMHSFANQHSVIHWVRDHRLHHKYSDTDGDPHNATRGFFYSHIGWLFVKKHEEVIKRGRALDLSDVYGNPILRFQHRNANTFLFLVAFLIPTFIPCYFWGENLFTAWHMNCLRFICSLNVTFLINSGNHKWGYRPYDKTIKPGENLTISVFALGEGFHNFHHVFPWDHRTGEFGNNYINLTTHVLRFLAWCGLAYDLKSVPDDVIRARKKRTGDGTNCWGWEDKEMTEEDIKCAVIENPIAA